MVATLDDVVASLTTLHDDLVALKASVDHVGLNTDGLVEVQFRTYAAGLFGVYITMLTSDILVPIGLVSFLESQLGFTMPTEAVGNAQIADLIRTHGRGRIG